MEKFRVLLSVSDKTGLVDFARALHECGAELIASGGTARQISDAKIPVRAVEEVTGFPEILAGRVKTLHPAIHGGILSRRTPQHLDELSEHGIAPIDLVAVNLYPFQDTIAQPNVTLTTAIEEIDIGGVALLRAAAKNHESVTVVCDPADYDAVAMEFAGSGPTPKQRKLLALKAFRHTADYDAAIAGYLAAQIGDEPAPLLPERMRVDLVRVQLNRYGENPHQQGGLYAYVDEPARFAVLHGKEMSYNNWLDLDGSWQAAQDFDDPTVAIIKHGNPCGLASADTLAEAYEKALASDPVSAFGSIVSVNRTLDLETVNRMSDLFVEVIAAPAYDDDALDQLMKKKNLRVVQPTGVPVREISMRSIYGGVLVQELDRSQADMNVENWKIVSRRQPTDKQVADMAFAWRLTRHVKSNAIIFVHDRATVGVGAGQMSRVDSVMLAGNKAGALARNAVMASDAFFPFADGIAEAAKHGIAAVVQPGGSVRDDEVIRVADDLDLVMAYTGTRHFRH
jgi:phosphoribosylaminoimidazolecarboxamide formyltransferase / IMP cyclohydrolase